MKILLAPVRFLCLLFLLSPFARAHVPFPNGTPLVIPLGETRSFYIVADVEEENATFYDFVSNTNDTVARVTSTLSFARKERGAWTIRADAIGETTMVFHWKYFKDRSGNEGERDETLVVQVVAPGSSAGANPYHITIADPVNSRNGEYHSVEAFGPRLGGPMPLGFSSYYSSSLVADGIAAGALGANRLHNFEWKLTTEAPNLRVNVRSDRGRLFTFEKLSLSDVWTQTGRVDTVCRLMEEEGIFYFFSPASQIVRTFDAAGNLTSVTDGRGNTHTLTYAGGQLTGVADGLGRALTFAYTGARLTRVTDHTGRRVDFIYTGANLARYTDALGNFTTYAYNAANLLTSFTRPEGNSPFTQTFTAGKVTSQTERGADTTAMAYGAGATTITQPGGATMIHTYAPTGEVTAYTDEGGETVTMTSDATGRRNGVHDREGDATGIAYHGPSGRPEAITNAEGRSSTIAYKPRLLKLEGVADKTKALTFFDVAKITFPDGTRESYTYDARGNLLSRTDRAGKKWKFTCNNRGQVLTTTNPLGGISAFTYDAAGNLASSKDPDTDATTYTYDVLNRPITITRPGGAAMTRAYDAADRLLMMTDERGKVTTFDYDDNNRLTTLTDPDAKTTTFAYDVLDRVEAVTDRVGAMGSVAYDSRRLLASVTDRNGNATTFDYDARQRPVTTTDAGGKVWTRGFDDEGLLTSAKNPVDPPGMVKRNKLGRIVEASDAFGNTARVTRDAMQRIIASFDPLGRATAYTYDQRGLLASATEQGAGTAKYDRDPLGSLSKITDPNGGKWLFSYTKAGRLAGMSDPLGRKSTHTYDARGRRAVTTFPDATTVTRTYDAASNVTRRLFTDGTDLTYAYDNLNRLTATNDLALSYDAEGRITNSAQAGENFGATYDAGGRLLTVTSPRNGGTLTVTYAYDSRNRLVSVGDNLSNATIAFTHDDAGRLLTMTRSNGVNATRTYDAAGRLTRIVDGAVLDLKYTLDAAGDVTLVDFTAPLIPGVTAATQALAFDKASQIATTGYAYDARGRLTTAPVGAFAWDGASRLKTAAGVALTYNGLSDVITRTAAAVTTRFFYNYALGLHPIVAEKTEGGAFTRHYVWTPGGRLLYAIDAASGQPVFYHFDRIGSTLALSDPSGAVSDTYAYGPYGEPLARAGTSTQPFTYVGAYGVRAEGGLHQMRARYYDPASARFLSPDPIWPSLAKPKRLNPYEYAAQSPGEYIDPSGSEEAKFDKDDFDAKINFLMFFAYALGPKGLLDIDTPESIAEELEASNAAYMAKLEADMNARLMADHEAWMAAAIRLDIVTANAAKFGGVVHSGAAGMVNQAVESGDPTGTATFKVAENDSPRPADRVTFIYDSFGSGCDLDAACGGEGFFDLFAGADDCVCPPNSNSDFYVNRHSEVRFKRENYPWARIPAKCALEPIGSALTDPGANLNPQQWVIEIH